MKLGVVDLFLHLIRERQHDWHYKTWDIYQKQNKRSI